MSVIDAATRVAPLFREALTKALGEAHAGEDPMLHPAQQANVQANLARGLGKRLGKSPREVAGA